MPTVRECLNQNPLYVSGVIYDKNFYKNEIPEARFDDEVDPAFLQKNYMISSCVEVAKKVALIALVVIPSCAILGSYVFAQIFLAGIAAGAVNDLLTSNESILKRIDFQSRLNACLQDKVYIQPLVDMLSCAAISSTACAIMTLASGILASLFLYGGAFMSGKILAEEIVSLGLDVVEREARARHELILQRAVN